MLVYCVQLSFGVLVVNSLSHCMLKFCLCTFLPWNISVHHSIVGSFVLFNLLRYSGWFGALTVFHIVM
jgi:hypothetical protein